MMSDNKGSRLRACERVLSANMEHFVKVGLALAEIRDDRLYEADGHASFKAYLAAKGSRFNLSERYAYQLIAASSLRKKVATVPAAQSEPIWTESLNPPWSVHPSNWGVG